MAHEALPENRIHVAERLSRPHPLVRETAAVLRQRRSSGDPVRPWRPDRRLDIRVTPKNLGRALRIFDALVKALEARGIPVSVVTGERRQTQIELFGEKVAFWLEEKTAQRPHVPTAVETEDGAGGRRKWDHVPSGQLRLRIMDYSLDSASKTWSDSQRARLENLLNDFVVRLAVAADGLRARTLRWKRWREEQAEAQRQRALAVRQADLGTDETGATPWVHATVPLNQPGGVTMNEQLTCQQSGCQGVLTEAGYRPVPGLQITSIWERSKCTVCGHEYLTEIPIATADLIIFGVQAQELRHGAEPPWDIRRLPQTVVPKLWPLLVENGFDPRGELMVCEKPDVDGFYFMQ